MWVFLPENVDLWRVVTEASDSFVIRRAESHHLPPSLIRGSQPTAHCTALRLSPHGRDGGEIIHLKPSIIVVNDGEYYVTMML